MPGESIGPYRIDSHLGAGGMGQVYRVTNERLGRTVAIKVSAAQFSHRFEREARTIASLHHPNICQIYDVGPNYWVMECIDGLPVVSNGPGSRHRSAMVKLLDFGLAKQNKQAA